MTHSSKRPFKMSCESFIDRLFFAEFTYIYTLPPVQKVSCETRFVFKVYRFFFFWVRMNNIGEKSRDKETKTGRSIMRFCYLHLQELTTSSHSPKHI